jgi:uncharacterized protein
MIFETIICSTKADGSPHLTPLGYTVAGDNVVLAPFEPSSTLDNLREHGVATLNMTVDVRIFAGCLTGRRDWPVVKADKIDAWRLRDALAHKELTVVERVEDDVRPKFFCEINFEQQHEVFQGFNRAQAAVVEASILATRLDWLSPEKIRAELEYLLIAVHKTGGGNERDAWQWVLEKIDSHPKHHGLIKHLEELSV